MIALSTSTPLRFTPKWHEAKGDAAPVYLIRSASVIDRELFEADLAGQFMAGAVYPAEWKEAFREGVTALLDDDAEAGRLADLYDGFRDEEINSAIEERAAGAVDAKDRALVDGAVEILTARWPGFATLVTRSSRRQALLPALAFQRFCVGWENIDAEFAANPAGGVAEAALLAVNSLDLRGTGHFIYRAMYGGGQAKNSAAPSKSAGKPKPSTSGGALRAVGNSKDKSG